MPASGSSRSGVDTPDQGSGEEGWRQYKRVVADNYSAADKEATLEFVWMIKTLAAQVVCECGVFGCRAFSNIDRDDVIPCDGDSISNGERNRNNDSNHNSNCNSDSYSDSDSDSTKIGNRNRSKTVIVIV